MSTVVRAAGEHGAAGGRGMQASARLRRSPRSGSCASAVRWGTPASHGRGHATDEEPGRRKVERKSGGHRRPKRSDRGRAREAQLASRDTGSRRTVVTSSTFSAAARSWFEASFLDSTAAEREGSPPIADKRDRACCLPPAGAAKAARAARLWALDRMAAEPPPERPCERRARVLYISPLRAPGVDVRRRTFALPFASRGARAEAGGALGPAPPPHVPTESALETGGAGTAAERSRSPAHPAQRAHRPHAGIAASGVDLAGAPDAAQRHDGNRRREPVV